MNLFTKICTAIFVIVSWTFVNTFASCSCSSKDAGVPSDPNLPSIITQTDKETVYTMKKEISNMIITNYYEGRITRYGGSTEEYISSIRRPVVENNIVIVDGEVYINYCVRFKHIIETNYDVETIIVTNKSKNKLSITNLEKE